MCEAASFIVTETDVLSHPHSDSHTDILAYHNIKDTSDNPRFVRVEIVPSTRNYNEPLATWKYKTDQDIVPHWYDAVEVEDRVRNALPAWAKRLNVLDMQELYNPIHPFKIKPKRMSETNKVMLIKNWASVGDSVWDSVRDSVWDSVWASGGASVWDSVRDSVRASVGDSVWDSGAASVWDSVMDSVRASVRDSVWASVRDSVWASVRDSVWDSVWAYIGSCCPGITKWRYAENLGPTPWVALRELWLAGYVPSFDGTTWRLHAGPKAAVVFEVKASDLNK